jgi:osmotically-inducible protein OsmY
MAENHRNQGSDTRFSSQEWDQDYNRQQRNWEDRYQENQGHMSPQNRDYGYSGNRYNRQNEEDNSGWNRNQSRGGNRMGSDYSSGNYGNENRNYGYGGREYGSNYGGGGYQGNSSYYDSGSYGNSNRSSYGSSRNLYDRDYDRWDRDRGGSSYTGLGASNYGGGYEDRGRRSYDENPYYGSSNPQNYRGYSGSNYGGNYYGGSYNRGNRDFGHGDANERSWWDRTKDEVSSWFGDDEAQRRRQRDDRMNFRGKGPRNYTRSDDRIKEDINDRLSDDSWVDASDIDVTVSGAEVTLTGTVNDRSEKRRAEDLAEAVSGVKHVENRIRVGKQESNLSSGTSSSIGTGTSVGSTGTTGSYAGSETTASQTGVTGTGASTGTSGQDKNKSKSSYVTG